VVGLICEEIWQPLFARALWNRREIGSFLAGISSTLLDEGNGRESIWRNTTLNAVNYSHQPGVLEDFLEHLTRKVAPKLRPLLTESKVALVEEDLKKVLADAIEFWDEAQKDGTRISVRTIPSKSSWGEALQFVIPEENAGEPFPQPLRSRGFGALMVFPEIIRYPSKSLTISNEANNTMADEKAVKTLCQGLALFEDTNLFDLGEDEQDEIAEATKQVPFQVTSKKRNSVNTRPDTPPSLPEKTGILAA
jgi:hypothetical protein